jgi:hypothetical protein
LSQTIKSKAYASYRDARRGPDRCSRGLTRPPLVAVTPFKSPDHQAEGWHSERGGRADAPAAALVKIPAETRFLLLPAAVLAAETWFLQLSARPSPPPPALIK